jgi:serine/threonine protein kinase
MIVEHHFKSAPAINGRYKILEHHIGRGSFGYIYKAVDIITDIEVAVKFEKKSSDHHLLEYEVRILNLLKDYLGFPQVYWFGEFEEYVVMVMQLFGMNMEELMSRNSINMKTVFQIGYQVLCSLHILHDLGFCMHFIYFIFCHCNLF